MIPNGPGCRGPAAYTREKEKSLGRAVGENRHDVELALQASHWLGSSVLRQVPVCPR